MEIDKKFKEEQLESTTIYDGKILKLVKDKVLCPSGRQSTREVIRDVKAVCILAIVDNKIIMEKQYRYPYDEILLELPAGKLNKGEDKLTAAIRELEEETGYLANDMEYLGDMYPSCGYTDEHIYLYACSNLKETNRHLDVNEVIDLYYYSFEEVEEMIKNNIIKDAKTVMAYSLYLLKHK